MRYFCWNFVSTPSANSEGYPILKTEFGSNSVRGRKNRKKARNHAVRNAVTAIHTRRRRRRSMSVFDGPDEESPAAAAAFDVPTAGVPTYFVASTAPVVAGFAASGFGAGLPPSGSAIRLSSCWFSTSRLPSKPRQQFVFQFRKPVCQTECFRSKLPAPIARL